jgi:hypothetical protein
LNFDKCHGFSRGYLQAAEKAVELAEGTTKDALKKKVDRIKAAAQEKK